MWEVAELAREIKAIEGVLSVGLFVGENGVQVQKRGGRAGGQKPVAAYFGMEDGSVVVRVAREDGKTSISHHAHGFATFTPDIGPSVHFRRATLIYRILPGTVIAGEQEGGS